MFLVQNLGASQIRPPFLVVCKKDHLGRNRPVGAANVHWSVGFVLCLDTVDNSDGMDQVFKKNNGFQLIRFVPVCDLVQANGLGLT